MNITNTLHNQRMRLFRNAYSYSHLYGTSLITMSIIYSKL